MREGTFTKLFQSKLSFNRKKKLFNQLSNFSSKRFKYPCGYKISFGLH